MSILKVNGDGNSILITKFDGSTQLVPKSGIIPPGSTLFNTPDNILSANISAIANISTFALNYTPVPETRTLTINGITYDLSADRSWTIAGGVTSFNTRTGAITLLNTDVTGALGYTPVTNARTLTINGTTYDLTADRSWTLATGLTNWTEAFSSATQATSSLTATNGAANVNAAICPKGTGAITAAIPDGTATGGNARGQYAVDLQTNRNAATQVASGNWSVVVGGRLNTASGYGSSIVGGGDVSVPNAASGSYSFIGGGTKNTVSGANSSIVGGGYSTSGNTIAAQQSFIGGGYSNSINGTGLNNYCSSIVGGVGNSLTGGASVICGGESASISKPEVNSGNWCFIGGGQGGRITGPYSNHGVLVGGFYNTIGNGYGMALVGGRDNSINGSQSFIGGGQNNAIGSFPTHAAIPGGQTNTISANGSHANIGGGQSNTASQVHSVVCGGQNNTASAAGSTVIGGYNATSRLYGQVSHASGQFSATGDAQAHELIWRRAITGTAQTELFLDGASTAAILPGTNSVWHGIIDISSICTVTGAGTTVVGDVAATSYKVTIKRIGTATSLVGTVQEIGTLNANTSMAAVAFLIDNNDTNESLRIQFTPPPTAAAATVIRVVATFRGQQIQY